MSIKCNFVLRRIKPHLSNILKINKTIIFLLIIILLGFSLRLILCMDDFLHPWDERFHALVAKNLINNFSEPRLYGNPVLNTEDLDWRYTTIWLHKQPLPLWSISASLYFFGTNEFFVRLPSLILSTLSLLLTFSIARHLFNEKIGLLAVFFQAINGFVIEITSGRVATDHIDVFFMFFIQLAIWFVIKYRESFQIRYLHFIGIALGLAVLSKWLVAMIVIPLFCIINLDKLNFKEQFRFSIYIFLTSVLVWLPWQIYTLYMYPLEAQAEQINVIKHYTEVLDGQSGDAMYYFTKIRTNYHDLVYIPLLWFLYKAVKYKSSINFFLLTWIVVPILFFSVSKTKMQGYLLFISPALFIVISAFLVEFYQWSKVHHVIKKLVVVAFFSFPIIYCVDRVFVKKYDSERISSVKLKNAKAIIDKPNVVVFNCKSYIEAMYYFRCVAYDYMPIQTQIDYLKSKKYILYCFDDDSGKPIKID